MHITGEVKKGKQILHVLNNKRAPKTDKNLNNTHF